MTREEAQYLLLGTFRKTGVRVDTPVWFAPEGDHYYVVSNNQAGKIKRLRNNSRCQIAPCSMLGKPFGDCRDSDAFIVDNEAEELVAHNALKRKYGWQMLLLDSGAWLSGRIRQRSYIRINQPKVSN